MVKYVSVISNTQQSFFFIMIENAAAESVEHQLHSLLNNESYKGFYGSISGCQRVQEVYTLID